MAGGSSEVRERAARRHEMQCDPQVPVARCYLSLPSGESALATTCKKSMHCVATLERGRSNRACEEAVGAQPIEVGRGPGKPLRGEQRLDLGARKGLCQQAEAVESGFAVFRYGLEHRIEEKAAAAVLSGGELVGYGLDRRVHLSKQPPRPVWMAAQIAAEQLERLGMTSQMMERLPPGRLVAASQPLAVVPADFAAGGERQLAEVEVPGLRRTRRQHKGQPATGEHAEARAAQCPEVHQRRREGRVAEAPLAVLVVL